MDPRTRAGACGGTGPSRGPQDDRVLCRPWSGKRDALPGGARESHGDPGARAAWAVSRRLSRFALSRDAEGRLDGAAEDLRHAAGRCRDPRHVSHALALCRADRQGRHRRPTPHAQRQAAQRAVAWCVAPIRAPSGGRHRDNLPRCGRPIAPPAGLADGRGRCAPLRGAGGRHSRHHWLVAHRGEQWGVCRRTIDS